MHLSRRLYVHIHTASMHMRVYTLTCMCTHTYTKSYLPTHTHTLAQAHTHTCTHAYSCTHIPSAIHADKHSSICDLGSTRSFTPHTVRLGGVDSCGEQRPTVNISLHDGRRNTVTVTTAASVTGSCAPLTAVLIRNLKCSCVWARPKESIQHLLPGLPYILSILFILHYLYNLCTSFETRSC